jgi:hypothetical protein
VNHEMKLALRNGLEAAAVGLVSAVLVLLALAMPACHESLPTVVGQTIDLTNAVCSLAPDSPVGEPYVEVVCAIAQGVEQVVSVAVGTLSSDASTTATMSVPVEQIRIRLPAPNAPAFLAAHKAH